VIDAVILTGQTIQACLYGDSRKGEQSESMMDRIKVVLDELNQSKPQGQMNMRLRVLEDDDYKSGVSDQASTVLADAFHSYGAFDWLAEVEPDPDKVDTMKKRLVKYAVAVGECLLRSSGGFTLVAERVDNDGSTSLVGALHSWPETDRKSGFLDSLKSAFRDIRVLFRVGLPPATSTWKSTRLLLNRMSACFIFETKREEAMIGHPEPYWYLCKIGVSSNAQGCGIGRRIMQAYTRITDALDIDIYLETETEQLMKFYEKCGFNVLIEYKVECKGSAPLEPIWGMRRIKHALNQT